jgi:hypothetical protein
MVVLGTSQGEHSGTPSKPECIRTTLQRDRELATAAHERELDYCATITEAVDRGFGVSVTERQVRETVLKCCRLGLLAEYAALD